MPAGTRPVSCRAATCTSQNANRRRTRPNTTPTPGQSKQQPASDVPAAPPPAAPRSAPARASAGPAPPRRRRRPRPIPSPATRGRAREMPRPARASIADGDARPRLWSGVRTSARKRFRPFSRDPTQAAAPKLAGSVSARPAGSRHAHLAACRSCHALRSGSLPRPRARRPTRLRRRRGPNVDAAASHRRVIVDVVGIVSRQRGCPPPAARNPRAELDGEGESLAESRRRARAGWQAPPRLGRVVLSRAGSGFVLARPL